VPLAAPGASATASRLKKVVWSAHGGLIFTGDDGGTLRAWDVAQLKCVRTLALAPGSANGVMDIEQAVDGATLFVAAGTRASVIDVASFSARTAVEMGPGGDVETVSLHGGGRWALVGGVDTFVRIYDLAAAGSAPAAELRGHHGRVHALRFSGDGSFFVSGADDATVRKWDFLKALQMGAPRPGAEPGAGVVGPGAAVGAGADGAGGARAAAAAAASAAAAAAAAAQQQQQQQQQQQDAAQRAALAAQQAAGAAAAHAQQYRAAELELYRQELLKQQMAAGAGAGGAQHFAG